jgi:nickel transport protein
MAAAIVVCLVTLPAQAHKVNVFAYVEGDRVIVEGYFSGNAKAQDSLVQIIDETGKKLLEGKTDKKGLYSFKLADLPPFSGSLRMVLDAEMGHKAEYTLSASDIPGAGTKDAPAGGQAPKQDPPKQEVPKQEVPKNQSLTEPAPAPAPPATASAPVVDQAALTAALGAVLDKKLEPIVRMLGKQEKLLLEEKFGGPKVSDIVGGIGWIIGLVGITAFFLSRNRSATKGSDRG